MEFHRSAAARGAPPGLLGRALCTVSMCGSGVSAPQSGPPGWSLPGEMGCRQETWGAWGPGQEPRLGRTDEERESDLLTSKSCTTGTSGEGDMQQPNTETEVTTTEATRQPPTNQRCQQGPGGAVSGGPRLPETQGCRGEAEHGAVQGPGKAAQASRITSCPREATRRVCLKAWEARAPGNQCPPSRTCRHSQGRVRACAQQCHFPVRGCPANCTTSQGPILHSILVQLSVLIPNWCLIWVT